MGKSRYAYGSSPEEFQVVAKIVEMYLAGRSGNDIAWYLNKNGIPSPMGKDWHESKIGYLLRAPRAQRLINHRKPASRKSPTKAACADCRRPLDVSCEDLLARGCLRCRGVATAAAAMDKKSPPLHGKVSCSACGDVTVRHAVDTRGRCPTCSLMACAPVAYRGSCER